MVTIVNAKISYRLHILTRAFQKLNMPYLNRVIDRITGLEDENWSRIVMRSECYKFIDRLGPQNLRVLEISGNHYSKFQFKNYQSLCFPEFDICMSKIPDDSFDLIIAEQVFEHLLWPRQAARNVFDMLNTHGYFIISVPFLVRIHDEPIDCTRWSKTGLKYFLAESGFNLENITTASWGNEACVKANLLQFCRYRSRVHSLENQDNYPYHVWAFAKK